MNKLAIYLMSACLSLAFYPLKLNMTSLEKRNLRKEARAIRHQLNRLGGGVFISGGALIVIALLVIILL